MLGRARQKDRDTPLEGVDILLADSEVTPGPPKNVTIMQVMFQTVLFVEIEWLSLFHLKAHGAFCRKICL